MYKYCYSNEGAIYAKGLFLCTQQQWADKRHLSILSFLCMRQRRTKYKVKVTPVGFCS